MKSKLFGLLFLLVGLLSTGHASAQQSLPHSAGQATTLLSDGRIFVTGGLKNGRAISDAYLISPLGEIQAIASGLLYPRAHHTATALPDGSVLIFGGIDEKNKYVRTMEIFQPRSLQFSSWSGLPLIPRARHTATLLTDGTVLIAGGAAEGGSFPSDIQLWNFRTGEIKSVDNALLLPRKDQVAQLLASGQVLLSDGVVRESRAASKAELYNPDTFSFQVLNENAIDFSADHAPVSLAAAIPVDGTQSYSIANFLKFRFSRPIDWTTVSTSSVKLASADGSLVDGDVEVGEAGRLAFLTPTQTLTPDTDYVVTLVGIKDLSGNDLPQTVISFHTDGTNDDGRDDDWIPDAAALNGNFQTRTGRSKWQELPPLKAPAGVTAVAGQVLGTSGRPLAHVTLQIENRKVQSDNTGRFLLKNIAPGHQILIIDGQTAKKAAAEYGFFEVGVDVKAGNTKVLNYTIWLTRLDTAHAIKIASPTTAADTVITTPRLPGLELHLPAGTTIVDRNGKRITELSITPVPLDKPPFPLPTGLKVPLYFTVQPGGAEIRIPGSGASMKGARLFYPNTYQEPSGTLYNFWNYDASSKGWYIYGNGQVATSKTQIVPSPGVYVYELTGAMVGGASAQPAIGPGPDGKHDGDPVDLASGQFIYSNTDLSMRDVLPIQITRTYIANDHYPRPFGVGTTDNYDMFMVGDQNPYTYQSLIMPDGNAIRFNRTSPGTSYTGAVYASSAQSGDMYGATISWNPNPNPLYPGYYGWVLKTRSGMLFGFPEAAAQNDQLHQALTGIQDPHGNVVTLQRDNNARLAKVTSPSGRSITLSYDASNRIIQATDSTSRTVAYTYDSGGRLQTITDVNGGVTTLTYDGNDLISAITDPRNITYLTNEYDSFGRVTKQTQADGSTYLFAWTPSQNISQQWITSGLPVDRYNSSNYEGYTGLISQVSVTDPRGYVRQVVFDNLGRTVSDTRAVGQAEQQSISYQHYADNLLSSVRDALGQITTLDYDGSGNLTSLTRFSGTANAVTTHATFDNGTNHVLNSTDAVGHTSSFAYDDAGDVTAFIDALGNATAFAYDSSGKLLAVTDPVGNTTRMSYTDSYLTAVIDPLGNQTTRIPDGRGNVIASTDPLGNITRYSYDSSDRVTSITNAIHKTASFAYDPNGDVTSIRDFLGHETTFTFDLMDRAVTVTDPLLRTSSITYDLAGYPVANTDRKGQVTSATFDGLGRRSFVAFGSVSGGSGTTYESSITYQYDSGGRLLSAADSLAGAVTFQYDDLNRAVTETSPQGSLTSTFDIAGRRKTTQTASGAQIQYAYDNANRLQTVTQGSSQVTMFYDNDGRRTAITLPNGIGASYSYDQNSRLQSLAYTANGTNIGSLGYVYDAAGRRTEVTGTLASTNLPLALSQANYDAANQLTSWNGLTPSYDANGSMIADVSGVQYSWNARNQLVSVNGTASLAFGYDALGRRVSKSSGSQSTSYQYDGYNSIAESDGGSAVTWLSGSVDEKFARTDVNGTLVPLTDGLSSTIALADNQGSLATSYRYDPYGNTTISGAISDNTAQYTGRENDGTGLYYYRARYYNPLLGRFISKDPIGFASGLNEYSYVGNDPVSFRDPLGMDRSPGGLPSLGAMKCWLFGCGKTAPDTGMPKADPQVAQQPTPPRLPPPCSSSAPNAGSIGALGDTFGAVSDFATGPNLPKGIFRNSEHVPVVTGAGVPFLPPTDYEQLVGTLAPATAEELASHISLGVNVYDGYALVKAEENLGAAVGNDVTNAIQPCAN